MGIHVIHEVSSKLPRSKYKGHLKPYWNEHLSALKHLKGKTYKSWGDAGRPRNPDNHLFTEYKQAKKNFSSTLSELARQYENEEVIKAVKSAEVNRNSFWNLVRRSKKIFGSKSLAIKRPDGIVVHCPDEVLELWKNHFSSLGTPKDSESFDAVHYREVTNLTKFNWELKPSIKEKQPALMTYQSSTSIMVGYDVFGETQRT